ncbi:MAG TPA: SpoIIE family protein phosphatase [Candidatus Sulfotelmatobacter sp.]|nr:SpoIIE family protein phosphatase [Candidatus Sulfotelmatobacter sp.]
MSPFLFYTLKPVTLTPTELRWDLLNVGVGVLLLVIGLASATLFFFRLKWRNRSLIYFGVFTILYAVRLLGDRMLIDSVIDVSIDFWRYFSFFISAVIVLPFGLYLYELVEPEVKRILPWVIGVQAICALGEIIGAIYRVRLADLNATNSIVTIATVIPSLIWILVARRKRPANHDIKVFFGGLIFWFLFVIYNNLSSLGVISGPPRSHGLEFIGFLGFVGCLGYITIRRSFATEERLLALDAELQIARQIQSSTLPQQLPKLADLDIAARYVPMSAVAGDFYDFLPDGPNRLGVLIADVAGHGVGAALIASMVKLAFAGQSAYVSDPAKLLREVNIALCGKFEEQYVTAAYVYIDCERNIVTYAGGGHPPLMLASRADGTVRRVEENGPILGMFAEAPYSALKIAFRPGDRLFLYTDGAFEAMNTSNEEYGKARVEQFLKTHLTMSPDALSSAFLADLSQWSGHAQGGQDDDITFVVLDFRDDRDAVPDESKLQTRVAG